MTFLRSFRLPEEVRAPMQEEAARRGVSVNRLVVDALRAALEGDDVVPVPVAPPVVAEDALSAPEKPSKPKAKAAPAPRKRGAEKPLVECRHGLPDCRICQTGRYAQ